MVNRVLSHRIREKFDGEMEYLYGPHKDCHCKSCLCLLAVSYQTRAHWWSTAFSYVPWRSRLWVLRFTHIRRRLIVDADSPQCDKGGVDDKGYKRMEDRADEHDALA